MVRNEEKYEQAVSLRKRGFTLEEIAKYCEISKSTASNWLQNKDFSVQVTAQNKRRAGQENAKRLKLVNKTRSGERVVRYREAARSAETEYKHYKRDPLFVAGLMLYFSEGDLNNKYTIRLSGKRPESHQIFISFAKEYLGIEQRQVRFWLLLHAGQSEEACMKKWRKATSLPFSQFGKTQFVPKPSIRKTLHFGFGNTIIGSTVLKQKLVRWIELAHKDLQN